MIHIYKTSEFANILRGKHFFLFDNYTILFWKEEENDYFIASIDPQKNDYNFADYLQLPDYAPYELVNGKFIFMAAPKINHQRSILKLAVLITPFVVKNKLGEVLISPCDVRFDEKNCCQPDLLFVSIERLPIIDENRVNEAPDLAVEVLSTNSKNDLVDKMETYAKFGVLEYWIIDLKSPKIEVFENQKGEMVLVQSAGAGGKIRSKVIKDFVLELNDIL
ncbi:MAG: Uma2 family endonuclease [Bacteroidetes bacterium]|nr:MAG: Uma2 family endonuclease [Bacteroidota bacterium]